MCVCSSSHSALYSPTCDTVFILSKLQQRCIVERQIPILSYQPSKFFNWLDISFPDFPRDRIRTAGEITSKIQLTLTYLSLTRENGVRRKNSFELLVFQQPPFNCIIVNEVLMQLQERGPFSLCACAHCARVKFHLLLLQHWLSVHCMSGDCSVLPGCSLFISAREEQRGTWGALRRPTRSPGLERV